MRNRILSVIMAVVMVLSMTALFTVGSSADGETNYTLTLGTVDVFCGQTAYVDVTLSATDMPSNLHIREWQITLSGDFTISETDSTFYGSGPSAISSFVNESTKKVGATCARDENLGTAAQVNADGGYRLATLALTATANTTVTATVDVLKVEVNGTTNRTSVLGNTTPVAGAINVYTAKALPEVLVVGRDVYFVGSIAAAIINDYEKIGLKIEFTDSSPARTFEDCTKTSVASTIIGVTSTNETTASQQGTLFFDGGDQVYLTSAVVQNVPAGTYSVTVSVNLDDGTGAQVVSGSAVTMTVTVNAA